MENIISIETKMTYADLKKFTWFSILRKGKGLKPSLIVMMVAVAVALVAVICLLLTEGTQGFSDTTAFVLIFLVVFPPVYVLMINMIAKNTWKASGAALSSPQRYDFSSESIQVDTNNPQFRGTSQFLYTGLYRACEVKDAFYLFANRQQALILAKRDMDGQTMDKLRELLEVRVGNKFVRCY